MFLDKVRCLLEEVDLEAPNSLTQQSLSPKRLQRTKQERDRKVLLLPLNEITLENPTAISSILPFK